jgi:hypothetical protein
MKEHEAFLHQARSDYRVFELLWEKDRNEVPGCHPLHYLQMATEKLAKAIMMVGSQEFDRYSHAAFSDLPHLVSRFDVASKLGHSDFRKFKQFLKRSTSIFHNIDELHPSIGPSQFGGGTSEGPNTEYPWQTRDLTGNQIWKAPAEHPFRILIQLRSGDGVQVLDLVAGLLERFEGIYQ